MSGPLDSEAALAAFVQKEIERSRVAVVARQLQEIEAVHLIGVAGEPTFVNGWVHYDSGLATPGPPGSRNAGFYRSNGRVYVQGVIKNGTAALAFTLPVGYRPLAQATFTTPASAGVAQVTIAGDGTVSIAALTTGAATATFTFLDGASFRYV